MIGLYYIWLLTAMHFISRQKKVNGVDINQRAVATISRGKIHIIELELDLLVQTAVRAGSPTLGAKLLSLEEKYRSLVRNIGRVQAQRRTLRAYLYTQFIEHVFPISRRGWGND